MYRKNVVIVIWDESVNLCLVGNRANFSSAWQFPQGGVDLGESFIDAAKRELYEEMGVSYYSQVQTYEDWLESKNRNQEHESKYEELGDFEQEYSKNSYATQYDRDLNWSSMPNVEFVKAVGPYRYDYPKGVNRKEEGQEQIWVLAKKNVENLPIRLNEEFSGYTWMKPRAIVDNIVAFKKDVYKEAMSELGLI